MVLESTMICIDNSDYQRNGDYFPTRLTAQKDGINLVCLRKIRSNPENNVGLLTLSNTIEVLATLASDAGRILAKMHAVQPKGNLNLITGVKIAHLVLKHRQGKNHKMRIVAFVGSPIEANESEFIKLAKRLKKEKVNVDIVCFGEHKNNNEILSTFINTLNGKDGTSSRLLIVPRGSALSDALLSSPIIIEDGEGNISSLGGSEFMYGVDPDEDPELLLALRVSMEEQRQRQEQQRRELAASNNATDTEMITAESDGMPVSSGIDYPATAAATTKTTTGAETTSSLDNMPDFENMTEEEQIAFAMQMSMQDAQVNRQDKQKSSGAAAAADEPIPMEIDHFNITGMTPESFISNYLDRESQSEGTTLKDSEGSSNADKDKKEDKKSNDKGSKKDK